MNPESDAIRALREALNVSPDNLPLRKHLARSLLDEGHYEAAEQEFRTALKSSPGDRELKLGLARAFFEQENHSGALLLLEELTAVTEAGAAEFELHARVLLRAGEIEKAIAQYRRALQIDPESTDPKIAELLGIGQAAKQAEVVDGRMRAATEEPGDEPDLEPELPDLTFDDVGGMDPLKEEIRMKIIFPLTRPDLYKAYGKRTGGGVLMYGPPGCGKTYLARATAGEIQGSFISVGLHDVLSMWIGESEHNLHAIFEQARETAPCVLFFDEADALGARRSDMRRSAGRHLINQFLSELDGVSSSNEGILVLAATNAPWHLDPALRRPGRFDRIIFVPPPDDEARAAILQIMLTDKPVAHIDHLRVAKKTKGFSGADLKALVELAVEDKLRDALKTGEPQPITTKDLLRAVKTCRPSAKEWFSTARNYAIYSNQDGLYDDVLQYLDVKK